MTQPTDAYLKHYGILGMKWGVRRSQSQLDKAAGRRGRNPDYSDQQRKRDKQVYGRRGVNRVNRSLNKGNKISVARGDEKTRRDRVIGKNKYVRQVGKGAGTVGAGAVGFVLARTAAKAAITSKGSAFLTKVLGGNQYAQPVANLLSNPYIQGTLALGAAKVGNMFAGDLAVSANMRVNGYDPSRR